MDILFERSDIDTARRSQRGAHYTSQADVMLLIEPVLMAPLRRAWSEAQEQAKTLAPMEKGALFASVAHQVATTTVLDPACGSGNFLYMALVSLLDLEKEIIEAAGGRGVRPRFTPNQLHGIEINPYSCGLARAVVWVGYLHWMERNGFSIPRIAV